MINKRKDKTFPLRAIFDIFNSYFKEEEMIEKTYTLYRQHCDIEYFTKQ